MSTVAHLRLRRCQGDRFVLLGRNGTGKTRLVMMLRRAIADPTVPTEGIKATPSLVLGYGNRFWLIDGKKLIETDSPEPFFEAARA